MARTTRKTSLAQQATKVPGLVGKDLAGGQTGYYWEPSKRLRTAGWKTLTLGTDKVAAIAAATARNGEVTTWEQGGAKPVEVAKIIAPHTFGGLIDKFVKEQMDDQARLARSEKPLAAATKREYRSSQKRLLEWAENGDTPVAAITKANCETFKAALLSARNARTGEVKRHRAAAVLRHLNMLLEFARGAGMIAANPMEHVRIPVPAPRERIIGTDAIVAVRAAALQLGRPDVELGIKLGLWTLLREDDILHLTHFNWRECSDMADQDRRALAGPDGRVMGFRIRPKKTKNSTGRWLDIHALPELREAVEAAFAANAARAVPLTCLVADVDEPRATPQWKFQRLFRDAVDRAREDAIKLGDDVLVDQLDDIKFSDLRRTGMCLMRQLGLTVPYIASVSGHSIDQTTKILETYMPADSHTNAAAIAMLATRLAIRDAAEAKKEKRA